MTGPGKYDDLCTYVRENSKAEGCIVIVFRGEHGSGFSVQVPPVLLAGLPLLLRNLADNIDRDIPADMRITAAKIYEKMGL